MRVYVHIDRLVLEGIAAGDLTVDRLAGSIQTELAGRISAEGLPVQLRSPAAVSYALGPAGESLQGRPAHRLGAGIGGALYGSLNQ